MQKLHDHVLPLFSAHTLTHALADLPANPLLVCIERGQQRCSVSASKALMPRGRREHHCVAATRRREKGAAHEEGQRKAIVGIEIQQ